MKTIIKHGLASGMMLLASCNGFVGKDDVSPNEPGNVPLAAQLPTAELTIFSTYGGAMGRNASMFIQQTVGVLNQSLDYGHYRITEVDVANDWQTLYNAGLTNTKEIISKAGDKNPYYRGVARIEQALIIGIATDYWGDVPYREAAFGVANLTPGYDPQEQILADIQSQLDSAIVDLSRPVKDNEELPIVADYIFGKGGSADPAEFTASWIQTARILKARYYLRLSKRSGNAAATNALAQINAIDAGSSSRDAYMIFGGNGNENNQWYAFEANRANYMKVAKGFVDTLKGAGDPRVPFYFAQNPAGEIVGSPLDPPSEDASFVGSSFASADSPLPLVTWAEALFIKAEAQQRLGQTTDAQATYQDAIRASMGRFTGISSDAINAYITAHGTFGADPLANILYEKYVHDYLHPEAWADWRRTGFPALSPNPGGVIDQIPRRYVTEQRERVNNPNAQGHIVSDLVTPVWWDGQ